MRADRWVRYSTVKTGTERALLASSRQDVRAVMARVHARRREFMVEAYRELGMTGEDARLFAATAYAAFVGAVMLSDQEPFCSEPALRAYAANVGRVLVPERVA